jgi:predicted HAD superfamily Cof-like phosphohydrolase
MLASYQNQYNGVGLFHEVFGHPRNVVPQTNIFSEDMTTVNFRISLIDEEVKEFIQAVNTNDIIEAVDGICDTLYVVNGAYHVLGASYPTSAITSFVDSDSVYTPNVLEVKATKIKSKIGLLLSMIDCLRSTSINHDYEGFVQTLHLIQIECYNLASTLGVDVDSCFNEVQSSNMSKVCTSEQEAIESVEWYRNTEKRYTDPQFRKSSNPLYWVIYDNATSKILKSINFKKPDLQSVIDNTSNHSNQVVQKTD